MATRDKIYTKRGPLVRGWGDSTPATINDVVVRVNGVQVDIAAVNPYIGEITLAVPIVLGPPGTTTVEVDYVWRSNPEFSLAGLNTPGLTLNSWSRGVKSSGRTAVGNSNNLGVAPSLTSRFPMSVVLNRPSWANPQQIGHTYIGYQREYSALVNDPTTLRLNNNPHAISAGNISADALLQNGLFDGKQSPPNEGWTLTGDDSGSIVGDGTYEIVSPTGAAGLYWREVDLALPTSVLDMARFRIPAADSLYGIFSGVGFGVHDGLRLVLVGALEMSDGMRHFGLLQNADRPDLESSWVIGPAAAATAATQSSIILTSIPSGVSAGTRFRVASGGQTGTYTIDSCGVSLDSDGNVILAFSPSLPENITGYGNGSFEILFETDWTTDLSSIRIVSAFPAGSVIAYIGGPVSGVLAEIDQAPAYPAETALLLPAVTSANKGAAFWGSLSRLTSSSSIWDLVQYASNPVAMVSTVQGVTVTENMSVLPQEDTSTPWFVTGGYGYSQVSGGELLLSSTASSASLDFEYSLSRIEPHLTQKRTTDFTATLRVDSGCLGSGDSQIRIRDTVREVLLTNLLYVETASGRALINDLPKVSLSGLLAPDSEGWTASPGNNLTSEPTGLSFLVTKNSSNSGTWVATASDPTVVGYEGMIAEVRIQITDPVSGTGDLVGPTFSVGVNVVGSSRVVTAVFALAPERLLLVDNAGATVLSVPFSWNDDEIHTYRLICDPLADLVSVIVDDSFLSSTALSGFPASVTTTFRMSFGCSGDGESIQRWYAVNSIALRPVAQSGQSIDRTFGFYTGKIVNDIDSYTIPRSDILPAKNSSLSAIPVPMDWTVDCDVRLYLDPTWGVGLYRPDLPPPPWASSDYTTETTNPSGAWVNVEYRRLPRGIFSRGEISFGSMDSRSITQQRWDSVSYRIRSRPYGAGSSPTGMVLNRSTTFKSGDRALQKAPEVLRVPLRTSNLVVVSDSAIYADRVFVVQSSTGAVIPSSNWSFDSSTQKIVFSTDVAGPYVTVSFAPSATPITKSYLCSRPIDQIVTVLNDGTPPIPKKRDGAITRSIVPDAGTGGDKVVFTSDETSRYAGVEYCEVSDGDRFPIAIMSDGPGLGEGLSEIGVGGRLTTDSFSVPGGPGGPFKGSATFKGSTARLHGLPLFLGGGRPSTIGLGTLNSAVLYPNARGPSGRAISNRMGLNQDFVFLYSDVNSDAWAILADDNIPPSGVPGIKNHGACAAVLMDFDGASRLGPWGGISSLQIRSLLGGGSQFNGTQFVLNGGVQMVPPVVTTMQIEAAN